MIIGHAAGIAAALALKNTVALQDVPASGLQKMLLDAGGVFEYGAEHQQRALAKLREKFAKPAMPAARAAWDRPPPASSK